MDICGQYKIVATVNGERFEKVFYNHWDSYLEGLGNVILGFIRKVESDKEGFLKRLSEMNFSSYSETSYHPDGRNLLYYLSGETKEGVIKNYVHNTGLTVERIESDFNAFEKGEYIVCGGSYYDIQYKYKIDFDEMEIEVYRLNYKGRGTFWKRTKYKFGEINEFK
jgi:hypothetical protein